MASIPIIAYSLLLVPFCIMALSKPDQKNVVHEKVAVADIALVIDQSASIHDHYHQELDFANKFINAFPIGPNQTRFALVQFSFANMTRVRLPWSQGTSKQKVVSTLESMENDTLGLGTDFARALNVAFEQLCQPEAGDRPDVPNVIVMVTDGFFNNPWERKQTSEAASRLRDSGVLLYAIQVKTDPALPAGVDTIKDLTMITGNRSRVFSVDNFEQLTNELLARITQQITVEYDNCVYEYVPVGGCYVDPKSGKCIMDGELKIERPARPPHGQQCPSVNRTQIDCQSDGCKSTGIDENTVNPLPGNAQQELGSPEVATAKLPFWAIILMAVVGGMILLIAMIVVIVWRTPRWRARFVPSKPRKPQLPGNMDDTHSSSSSATSNNYEMSP